MPAHDLTALPIFLRQLKNPLLIILLVATCLSYAFGEKYSAAVILWMIFLSVAMGFWNEYRAEKTMSDLLKKISFTATVIRGGTKMIVPVKDILSTDQVFLSPGCVVPADLQLVDEHRLEINESVLSGESLPVSKSRHDLKVYMGTIVVSGSGTGRIVALGKDTKFGQLAKEVSAPKTETSFQKGLSRFSVLILRVIIIMAILIFAINFLLGRSLLESVLFSLSIAIGLTPELLPVIVTVSLAHGAKKLSHRDIIVKQLVAIEDLGNMEVLCCDKTGTLTEGKLQLVSHQNATGEEDDRILELGLICNSAVVHHHVSGDSIDRTIWEHALSHRFALPHSYNKTFEQPFDYEHRAMFCVTKTATRYTYIYKGAPEVVLAGCAKSAALSRYSAKISQWYASGFRVIAIATKNVSSHERYTFSDARNLHLAGFILFSDPPKKSAKSALDTFSKLGVQIKILTGDNEFVTRKICTQLNLLDRKYITGPELSRLSEEEFATGVWSYDVFARMTPDLKLRVIRALRHGGHTVGFLGDGINDAPALHEADAGISVNTAVDVAKDTASIVLLKSGLQVIAEGIMEGRRTFANTLKYILMGTSSNFGNMFSMAGASFLLPFLPMAPTQILLTNSLYDLSQISIPTDRVDEEVLLRPQKWDIGVIQKYMLFFGPLSSIYDFMTFAVMFYIFRARGALFQTGWFVESLVTEIMVIFIIRTRRVPFFTSRPSLPLLLTCITVVSIGIMLPFSPLSAFFTFTPLPSLYFFILVIMTLTYLGIVELGKKLFRL